jgi:hypothetical protein
MSVPLKMLVVMVVGFLALLAMLIYAPIAILREFRRSDRDVGGEAWMGSARGRKQRLAIILLVFGVLVAAGAVFVMQEDPPAGSRLPTEDRWERPNRFPIPDGLDRDQRIPDRE